MAAIDAAIQGLQKSLDPAGHIDAPPDFEVRKTIRRGGLTIEAGNVDGWNVLRYIRAGWTATAIVAYSDEWFFLRVWPASVLGMEDGLAGIMREVREVA